jgi:hypothetical protein
LILKNNFIKINNKCNKYNNGFGYKIESRKMGINIR